MGRGGGWGGECEEQIRWVRRNFAMCNMCNDMIWEMLCARVGDAKLVATAEAGANRLR
jgi:hypothetical protein